MPSDQNLVIMSNNDAIMSDHCYLLLPIMNLVIMCNNNVIMSIHYYVLLPIMDLCTKMYAYLLHQPWLVQERSLICNNEMEQYPVSVYYALLLPNVCVLPRIINGYCPCMITNGLFIAFPAYLRDSMAEPL